MASGYHKYQLTIDKILESAVRRNPNQTIEYRDVSSITYSDFKKRVLNLSKSLLKLGLAKGDVVAVVDWDTDRYLTSYYAVPMAGGILHTVNIRYPPELIYYSMKDAGDKYVIIRDEFVPLIEKFIEMFSFIDGWIVYSESGKFETKLKPVYNFDDLVKDPEEFSRIKSGGDMEEVGDSVGSETLSLPALSEDDPATIFYTSGTTGMPKGVTFTHRDLTLHTLSLMAGISDKPIGVANEDVVMPLVPMFHVHSWGFPFWVLLKGNKYVLPGKYEYGKLLELIDRHKVTVSAMVPPILYLLMSEPEAQRVLGKSGLRATIGGGALSEGLARKAEQMGVSLISGYGMSETAPVLTLASFTQDVLAMPEEKRFGFRLKAGVPIYLVDLRVVDTDFNDVSWDSASIGEIVVRSPWLTSGYWHNDEASEELWRGGWLHTGDLAVVDEHGYVKIVDREKDAVKSGGEFIPTILLEDIISTINGVEEVAVIGKPDEKWGERPVAFVTSKAPIDAKLLRDALENAVDTGRIGKFWIPDDFIQVEAFTKTSTGKIDKKPLKERFKQ